MTMLGILRALKVCELVFVTVRDRVVRKRLKEALASCFVAGTYIPFLSQTSLSSLDMSEVVV